MSQQLNFDTYLNNICQKVNQKIHAFVRITKNILQTKHRAPMEAFGTCQFPCFPLNPFYIQFFLYPGIELKDSG